MDNRRKASLSQVNSEVKPFIKKHLLGKNTVEANDINSLVRALLTKYSNVQISQGVAPGVDGKPWLKIKVKGMIKTSEILLEVEGKYRPPKSKGKKLDLGWIDEIEDYLAATED